SWFAGFAEDLLAVAWMGRDDNGKTSLTGATGALQLWSELMRSAAPTSLSTSVPEGIAEVWVDPEQGLQVSEPCPGVVRMPYVRGSEPEAGFYCGLPAVPEPADEGGKVRGWLKGWLNR